MILVMLVFCTVIGIVATIALLVGVSAYDIAAIRRLRQQNRTRRKPKIALVVQYKSIADASRIVRMAAIPYKNLFIIVINQSRKSNVKQTLNANNKRLVIYSSQRSTQEAIVYACKKYQYTKGLIAVIGENSEIDEVSLSEMIDYMSDRTSPKSALLNRFYLTHFNLGGLINSYQQNFVQLVRKTRSAFGLPILTTKHDTVVYKDPAYIASETVQTKFIATSTAFLEFDSNIWQVLAKQIKTKIDSWIHSKELLFAKGNTMRAWLDWLFYLIRQLALFTLVLPLGYFIYVAISLHQPILLFVSIGIVSLFILYAAWSDSQLDVHDKLLSVIQLPVTYLLLPFWALLPVVALIVYVLEMLTNMIETKFPRRISLFSRIKDILRIV